MNLPPPSTSADTTDSASPSTSMNRKRQRSQSMQTSEASSPKRSASEDPFVDPARDIRVDDPMIISSTSVDPANIDALLNRSLHIGESWYIIPKRWLDRWKIACTGKEDKVHGVVLESDLGPPDQENQSFVDENGHLISTISEKEPVLVPQEVWDAFITKYGGPTCPLPRKVVPRGVSGIPEIEMHPCLLRVVRLVEQSTSDPGPLLPPIAISAGLTLAEMSLALAAPFNEHERAHRIWADIYPVDWTRYPRAKLIEDCGKLLEETQELVGDRFETGDSFAVEFQENGDWLVDAEKVGSNSAGASQVVLVNDTAEPIPLFGSGKGFFAGIETTIKEKQPKEKQPATATKLSKSVSLVPSSSKRAQDPGTLGLGNMGNTCFMNSALQCLAHTKELCQYFVSGVFESELNPDNPLGMHGAIAQTFGALLKRIWSNSSSSTSYSPREFKQQLQRFAPQFIGYQQHDSQELVAFLLDGLHEDLNRILKKPYVEKPDWEGGGDKELVELANTSWDGYLQRNDSVIVDLFQGQYKSTLVCPECDKVSITFDPFMYLTLPLPIQKKWWHSVLYIPWDIKSTILRVMVETNRDASFKDLRKILGRWMNTPAEHLLMVELFQHRFYKNLDDTVMCSETAEHDMILCYELPCNSQQGRMYKRKPEDPFIVPVYTHEGSPKTNTYGRGTASFFGYPTIAVIDKETAKWKDSIYAAVVERLEQWTKNSQDLYTWEGSLPASPDSMMEEVSIPINGLPPADTVTEIKENGEVVTLSEVPEEGDITDEKEMVIRETEKSAETELRKLGPKHGLFELQIQNTTSPFASAFYNTSHLETWEKREQASLPDDENDEISRNPLLRDGDMFMCEFDTHMKDYYYPDLPSLDNQLWSIAQTFEHPEYLASKKTDSARSSEGITLQDCLDEFTKEEKLGEDDLWYCPRCKKHQQATKRFDLWKLPDVLVVHLKRFSNSRTLRDKIDTLVEFPVEGLDLEAMVGERTVAKSLLQQGVDVASMGLHDVEEPLLYDLYAVDEHLGGLGGGHYRAYALNHANGKWYHFDDSYVKEAGAKDAVNPNAYLLFYKRRTSRALGGKTYEKIKAAGMDRDVPWPENSSEPAEPESHQLYSTLPEPILPHQFQNAYDSSMMKPQNLPLFGGMLAPSPSPPRNTQIWSPTTSNSSPPALDEELPGFEESQNDRLAEVSLSYVGQHQYTWPDPDRSSPTSSNEATLTFATQALEDEFNETTRSALRSSMRRVNESPPGSTSDEDMNPFYDEKTKVDSVSEMTVDETPVDEIPVDASTLNEIDL